METCNKFTAQKFQPFFLITITFLGVGFLVSNSAAFPSNSNNSGEKSTVAAHLNSTTTTTTSTTTTTTTTSTASPTTIVTTVSPSSARTKTIEPCVPKICEEKICRVNGSISRPSFYARCPSPSENEQDKDVSKYCMCASAYHASATEENSQFYVTITPDTNCYVPEMDEDKGLCEQRMCQGASKKSDRLAHICQHEEKYYCACFN